VKVASTRVKICGITNPGDAKAAAEFGADAIGMVFYAKSPRHVADLGLAKEIAQAVGPFVNVVGLFVDAVASEVERVLKHVPLSTLQFHGAEQVEYCESFERPYLKAVRMKPGANTAEIIAKYPSALGILLDAYVKGIPGGTGQRFDWESIPEFPQPLVLAGGLAPDNITSAIQAVRPHAVDVSGGVEKEPGLKDLEKTKQFIDFVKDGAS
jgi:phosphoribosylanthranilate isomerase